MEKRLETILAHAGVASRRKAAILIESGRVTVDGEVVREKGARFEPSEHQISVNDTPIVQEEKKYYFVFNKPADVITTVEDTHGRKKVSDFFKNVKARLYPVGRLDKNTTGLLLVTNDGRLAHGLSHPSSEVKKVYHVTMRPDPDKEDIVKLSTGIIIEGKRTAPCKIEFLGKTRDVALYSITLHEGRKRQIRNMIEAVGSKVLTLKRVRYGNITLGNLKEGESRALTPEEIKKIDALIKKKN